MRDAPLYPGISTELLLMLIMAAALTGCASSRPATTPSSGTQSASTVETEQQLRASVKEWHGTPYALGGSSTRGIDCSAFVQRLYRDVLGVPVPRTTEEQVRTGRSIPADEAQAGDLVFFRPERKQRHVGVYLGDGEFAHASTSQGVMISDFHDAYWQDIYWMTRRLLPDSPASHRTEPAKEASPRAVRAGW